MLQQPPGAAPSTWPRASGPQAEFSYTKGLLLAGRAVRFDASASTADGKIVRYQWLFGDGMRASGALVDHVFGDALGTMLDGSGRFRVQLIVTDAQGRSDTIARPVVLATRLLAPSTAGRVAPGRTPAADGSRQGYVSIPADGGYMFTVMARDGAHALGH